MSRDDGGARGSLWDRPGGDAAFLLNLLLMPTTLVWSTVVLRWAHLARQSGENVPLFWQGIGQLLLLALGGWLSVWLRSAIRVRATAGLVWAHRMLVAVMVGTTVFSLYVLSLGRDGCVAGC